MNKYNQNTNNIQKQINLTQEDFFNTQEPKFVPIQTKQDRQYKPQVQQQQSKSQKKKRDVSHDIFGFQPQQIKPHGHQLNRDITQENFDGDENYLTPKSPRNQSQNYDNISQKSWNSKRSYRSRKSFTDNNPLLKPLSQMANKSVSNISQKSNMSRRDKFIQDLSSDPYQLKAQIKSLDKEIIHLKTNIDNFNETDDTRYKNPSQHKQDEDLLKINRLEVELINEKVSNKKLLKKKQKLEKYEQDQIQSYENYMKQMKDKFKNNIEKNKDTMTAELSFKYNNNDEETIKCLQRLLKNFQKEKKILGIPLKRQFLNYNL